jgi:ribosomal protein S18 acetylase RimI-like enzyme
MDVRQLGPADAPAYQRLRLLSLRESPSAFSASYEDEADRSIDEVAARITPASDGSICMLGIFEHDELCGFVAVIRPRRAKLRHGAELAGMYVAPTFRRRGFGSALLNAAIAHIRSMGGVHHIKLGVNDTNTAAKALYQSVGFERYGVEPAALNIDGTFYNEERYILRLNEQDDG